MEKLKAIIGFLTKRFGIKSENGEFEKEIGRCSMNEGEPEKVFGFRREVVKGVVVFFGTVLVLESIFASGDDETENNKENMTVATESEVASARRTRNELPNDYETLIAMSKAKEEELRRIEEEKAQKAPTPPPENVVVAESPKSVVPEVKIPQENYEVVPPLPPIPQNLVLPEKQLEKEIPKVKSETNDEKLKSPISFSLGGKNLSDNEGRQNELRNKSVTQVKLEYIAPDNATLGAGTVIPVVLLTGINTDVEGQVMAQVLSDVYDTATGKQILIPQGSKLTGYYDKKAVNNGRVPVNFEQIMFPDGGSCSISEDMIAMDGAGYTGISGKVHHHTGQKISAGVLGTTIAALGTMAAGNVSANNDNYTAGQIAAQGATANLIDATSNLLREASNVSNTVTIDPGYEFNVYVTHNIIF